MSMRVAALVIAIALIGAVQAQATFPDVPERHWAGEAVARLADLGILVGFPDGSFRGNEGITRYEAALVIDRLLTVVRDDAAAADAALDDQLSTLRAAVMALADEAEELQRRVGANREALDALFAEVAALREELGLPAPAPLPPYPPEAPDAERPAEDAAPDRPATPAVGPAEPGDVDAPEADASDAPDAPGVGAPDGGVADDVTDPPSPIGDGPAEAGDAPTDERTDDRDPIADGPGRAPGPETLPDGDVPVPQGIEAAAGTEAPTFYVGLAGGASVPLHPLVRATVGVEDAFGDRFGVRLSMDLGRRSARPLGSVAFLGHATYRLVDPAPVGAYVGAGAGIHLGGNGAMASVLAGGTWTGLDPVHVFVEATVDLYLAATLPGGASRFEPTVVAGARWTF